MFPEGMELNDGRTWRGIFGDYLTVRTRKRLYVTEKRFGAVPDDPSIDNVGAIQAALNLAMQEGSTDIVLPHGRYYLTESYYRSGLRWHLWLKGRNIRLVGPGCLVSRTPGASILMTYNAHNWLPEWIGRNAVLVPMEPAQCGDVSVKVNDASGFSVGDMVHIQTGQTLAGLVSEPDAELNEITGITGDVLRLRSPLTKSYAQEYYISGNTGVTSLEETENPARFGVARVTNELSRDISIIGVGFENPDNGAAPILGGQIDGFTLADCYANVWGHFQSMGTYRNAHIENNRIRVYGSGVWKYGFTAATGCSFITFRGNRVESNRITYGHTHEGSAAIRWIDNTWLVTPTEAHENVHSIRARAYDVTLRGEYIINGGNASPIYVSSTCKGGGIIDGCTLRGKFGPNAIAMRGGGWYVGVNDLDGKAVSNTAADYGNVPPVFVQTGSN